MIAPLSTPPILLHVSCAGAWGGDTAYTLDIDRVIRVTARTDCKVAHFPFHKLQVLTQHMPEVWAGLARLTAGHIKHMMTIVACGLEKNSNNRVSLNLLRLIGDGQMFGLGSEGDPKELPLSQSELAEMTSLSRNSVGIILKDLEAIGAIEVSYRNIKILNRKLLLIPS
ncbi:Crp/Fnr family transcriptional regulator [Roseovarius sp. EL26]|uniref:Crp/Fnr family transcriptional regulator n=1 Tax=Roseovarius sp. EL26 TaxID=2126672 RepID=UPI0013C4FB21|nr:Crp/Fnr family transcriptional regulator [Roseovarius sp. EL26]